VSFSISILRHLFSETLTSLYLYLGLTFVVLGIGLPDGVLLIVKLPLLWLLVAPYWVLSLHLGRYSLKYQ
jgi:hypothetical protein